MKRRNLTLLMALAAILVCGPAFAQDWQAGAGADWQRVLAAAKQEGRVSVAGPAELAVPITDGFRRDTGIAVDYLGAVASMTESRVGREARAGNVTIDFIFTGTGLLPLVKDGLVEDEKSRLLLPDVTDLKNWTDGRLKWVDNDQKYLLQTQAFVSSTPYYDRTAFPPEGLKSWHELLDPKLKGKIVAYDPRSGGPGQQMAGYIGAQFGIDFLKSLYIGQAVTFSQDSRQMVEWLARGVDAVGLGVIAVDYLRMRDAGISNLAVATNLPDGPGTISGGFSVALIPKGEPHPNAATVFLNWFASRSGQAIYSHVEKQQSRRIDVHDPSIPDFVVPKPDRKYLDQYSEAWALNQRAKIIASVLQALGGR
jgi:ABC-type Fe3+ transport system substrate-binding protein